MLKSKCDELRSTLKLLQDNEITAINNVACEKQLSELTLTLENERRTTSELECQIEAIPKHQKSECTSYGAKLLLYYQLGLDFDQGLATSTTRFIHQLILAAS